MPRKKRVSNIAERCRIVADGAGAACDDSPAALQNVLKASSDTLMEAAVAIERLQWAASCASDSAKEPIQVAGANRIESE